MTTPLPGVFGTLAPVLDQYGYLAVAGFVLLEDFGVPVPGETILIAGAVYAGAGRLSVVALAIIAFLAAVAGDSIGYAIGHLGGRRLALRWGRYVLLTPERLNRAEGFFDRHGGKVVTIARFIEGLRQANGIIAGIVEMPWLRRFLPFNALGAALWVGVWVTVGDVAGDHIGVLYNQFSRYEIFIVAALAALILGVLLRGIHRRRRRRDWTPAPDSPTESRQAR